MKFVLATLIFSFGFIPAHAEDKALARHTKRNVEVEFETVEGASLYEIKITPTTGTKKPTLFKLATPKWSANVKPGLYSMQLRAYDDRGVPGDWSPATELKVKLEVVQLKLPVEGALLKSKATGKDDVHLQWDSVPSAVKYQIHVQSKDSDFKLDKETDGLELNVVLPVANNFDWNVVAIDNKDEPGEVADKPATFAFAGGRLGAPKIQPPLSKFVEDVDWTAPESAREYATILEYKDPKTGTWTQIERKEDIRETTLPFDISRPSGRYRLNVVAKAPLREDSKVARREFDVIGGFKNPDELKTAQKRTAVTRSTDNYFIASYMVSDITYSAQNYDTNSNANFSAVGGTVRVGYGHQKAESNWGGFIVADMSGFSIDGQTQTYASSEAHITRKIEFGQSGLLLAGAGVFYKNLPTVTGSPTFGFESLGKLSEIGPHLGATYWLPLTQRWGLQANIRLYDGMFGTGTNGGKLENSMSYQLGVLGSYRLSPNWLGYLGYALRHDEAHYDASPQPQVNFSSAGEVNSITIDGHYINLMFEYSF